MTPTELFDRNTHKGMMRRKEDIDLWANQLTMDEEWLATASSGWAACGQFHFRRTEALCRTRPAGILH